MGERSSERDLSWRESDRDEEAVGLEAAQERVSGFWLAWNNNPLHQRIIFIFVPLICWLSSIVFLAVFNTPSWDIVRAGFCGGLVLLILLLYITYQVIVRRMKRL